eukprot:3407830-Pyramimonas_sp.AAC.1
MLSNHTPRRCVITEEIALDFFKEVARERPDSAGSRGVKSWCTCHERYLTVLSCKELHFRRLAILLRHAATPTPQPGRLGARVLRLKAPCEKSVRHALYRDV